MEEWTGYLTLNPVHHLILQILMLTNKPASVAQGRAATARVAATL